MAKEFDKFSADYKKLAPGLKGLTKDEATRLAKRMTATFLICTGSATDHVEESIARARNEGVTGTRIADFAKNKHVVGALQAYQGAVADHTKAQQAFEVFTNQAKDAITALDKLVVAIDKDLKSRSGRSESKSQIEDLRGTIDDTRVALAPVAAAYSKVHVAQREFVGKATQNLDKLAAKAPQGGQTKLDNTMLPQMLVDRNRKRTVSQANIAAREIVTACDDALNLAATDLAAARNSIKPAVDRLKDLQKLRDEFVKAYDHSSARGLAGTKDYEAVKKAKEDIEKFYEVAERKLRGAATTMKKA